MPNRGFHILLFERSEFKMCAGTAKATSDNLFLSLTAPKGRRACEATLPRQLFSGQNKGLKIELNPFPMDPLRDRRASQVALNYAVVSV